MEYGGFWIRVGAYLVDFVIMLVVMVVIGFATGENIFDTSSTAALSYGLTDFIGLIFGIAYFAGFESSSWQATPGKRARKEIMQALLALSKCNHDEADQQD